MPRIKARDNYKNNFRALLIETMKAMGKDFTKCEQCGKELNGRFDLHHTKYEDATIHDLQIVCKSCNHKRKNLRLF